VSPIRNNGVTIRKAANVIVENVAGHHSGSGGLVVEKHSENLLIRHFEAYGNIFDGLAGYQSENSLHEEIYLHDNLASGVSIDVSYDKAWFKRICFENNYDNGIFARYSKDNAFVDGFLNNNCSFGVYTSESGPHEPVLNYSFRNLKIARSGRGFAAAAKVGLTVSSASSKGFSAERMTFADNPGGEFGLVPGASITVDGKLRDRPAAATKAEPWEDWSKIQMAPECKAGLGVGADNNANCSATGGHIVRGDDTCRCRDGYPAFKMNRFKGILVDGHAIYTCDDYHAARDKDLIPFDLLND
jgi:hypothetical protein